MGLAVWGVVGVLLARGYGLKRFWVLDLDGMLCVGVLVAAGLWARLCSLWVEFIGFVLIVVGSFWGEFGHCVGLDMQVSCMVSGFSGSGDVVCVW